MSVARITGTNVNVNSQELIGVSPSISNSYTNEMGACVKRPGLGFQMDVGTSGISGFYDWVDQSQVIITCYDGSIYRLNSSGLVLLSSSAVKCGPLRPTFDGNGYKLWIASGGKMINILADTEAGGAIYLPAYTVATPHPVNNVDGVTSGTAQLTAGVSTTANTISVDSSANIPTNYPYDAMLYSAAALGPTDSYVNGTAELITVTSVDSTGLILTVTRAIEPITFGAGDYIVGPVVMALTPPPDNVSVVKFYDGYIICNQLGTGKMYYNDGPAISPTDSNNDLWTNQGYISAEYKPDNITAIECWYHEIFLFGVRSIEVWYNDGYTPFSKVEGTQLDVGIISPSSLVSYANIPYFMTSERQIVTYSGRTIVPISGAIQAELDNMSVANDVIANVITDNGQAFLLFSFPTARVSWAYNVGTGRWSPWYNPDQSGIINIGAASRINDTSFTSANNLTEMGWASNVSSVTSSATSLAWSDPGNVEGIPNLFTSGTSVATFTPSAGVNSDWLVASSFGLTIPQNSNITGIAATVFFFEDGSNQAQNLGQAILGDMGGMPTGSSIVSSNTVSFMDSGVQLTGSSNVSGASIPLIGTVSRTVANPENIDSITYGGIGNTWGKNITPSDISNIGFRWRASASTSSSSVLTVYAMGITVYYSSNDLVTGTGATWCGDPYTGRIYSVSSSNYSDELTSDVHGVVKSPIKVIIETPPLGYGTLRRKMSQEIRLRCRTDSHAMFLYINDDYKGYGNAIPIAANTGLYVRRNLGVFTNRQYKIVHLLDCGFSFIDFEEFVKGLA